MKKISNQGIYKSPTIQMIKIYTEEGFAAGSAKVRPHDDKNKVYEEWQDLPDDNRNIDW
ncbi:hypothetical protein GCM10022216_18630 [Sphingobacterium kyonggiense]|uniref:Uncharacterized protein n=1 Tax=Sphingobacterium kyonggiense TaxID=714075 RepID=A0ABP7YQT9_9SPHI